MWFFACKLIRQHKHIQAHTNADTYTQRNTAHSGANKLTQPYKYTLTPPDMCSKQLFVLH